MAHSAHRLSARKKAAFTAVVFVVAFGLLEAGLRVVGLGPLARPPAGTPSVNRYYWVPDRALGFRNRPNGRYTFWEMAGQPVSTTDAQGLRNGTYAQATAQVPAVLFLGDSTTFCAEVDDDQTVPSAVARQLEPTQPLRMLNTACRGYNTVQCRRMLDECLAQFAEVKVAVYVYCWNDLIGNLEEGEASPGFRPTLKWNAVSTSWREVEPTGALPREEAPSGRVKFTNLLRSHSALVHHSLYGLRRIEDLARGSPVRPAGEEPTPAPGAVDSPQRAEDALVVLLQQMAAACRQRGVQFLVAAFTWDSFDPPSIAGCCTRAGVRFVSVKEQFQARDSRIYLAKRTDGRYDAHYGAVGTRAFAAGLAPAVQQALDRASAASAAQKHPAIALQPGPGH